ncbi:HAD-IIIA family hydrolase [Candidatus Micrarchaeota archaeon]|nr:HAD-IIIA family hydrolase [Candidatus Micrarchaeota archaeon]
MDRDGVIIKDWHHDTGNHLTKTSQIEFLQGASQAIQKLNKHFLVILVANQSTVARGLVSLEQAQKLNRFLQTELEKKGARLDAVFFCPHHPDFSGNCDCRKPKKGLFLQADKAFGIDFKKSFLVGDKTSDIAAGKKVGCVTILVQTGYGGKDALKKIKPDFVVADLSKAADSIINSLK